VEDFVVAVAACCLGFASLVPARMEAMMRERIDGLSSSVACVLAMQSSEAA
jgi:hypothetical protein